MTNGPKKRRPKTTETIFEAMRALALTLFVFAIFLAGCRPLPSKPLVPGARESTELSTDDEVSIYQAVIRYLFEPSIVGGTLAVYIVCTTNDAAADPSMRASVPVVLPATVQAGITAALGDFASQVIWVDKFDDVKLNKDTGGVIGRGVIIQLGNIKLEDGNRALVPGSIYAEEAVAGGAIYVAERMAGIWRVTGTHGGFWSSP
jgi:hypothetical protein